MRIERILDNKKRYIELLLLADEQETMIDKYLERGDMFALFEEDLKTVCVVTKEGDGTFEIKNIATEPKYQGKGYGKKLIEYVVEFYEDECDTLLVGTGDSDLTIPFYRRCGFEESHSIRNFFTDNYDHPIYECGKQLVDMVYLKRVYKR
ncbi:MAG: GNAT family N-acetyltransferase [Clostridiales bacterium]|nr:GNAT family N-acetyltransferase [uncultured Anaerosporobacter sp.]MBS5934583.1 GNAT family N-acetyltransferase [Clostridiales bacterium]